MDGVSSGPVGVPARHVFVLGDPRGESEDSRDFGAIPRDALVDARFWPLSRAGAVR